MNYQEVLHFWFEELTPKDWYKKSDALDEKIKDQFESIYHNIVAGEMAHWRESPQGRLAEVIVLDQFSRNMFRGDAQSFAADTLALALAQEAIRSGDDLRVEESQRAFFYMPFMHSESKVAHAHAEKIFKAIGGGSYDYELKHKKIIDEFGRYPYRNKILGRTSTDAEKKWLENNDSF